MIVLLIQYDEHSRIYVNLIVLGTSDSDSVMHEQMSMPDSQTRKKSALPSAHEGREYVAERGCPFQKKYMSLHILCSREDSIRKREVLSQNRGLVHESGSVYVCLVPRTMGFVIWHLAKDTILLR
jgi:hypothetical protein